MSDMTYTFQTRRTQDADWQTLAADPWAYRNGVAESMQTAGLRYSEIAGHLDDLKAGEVLTADNGRQYRAVEADVTVPAAGFRVSAGQSGSDVGTWLAYGYGGHIVSRRATREEAIADTHEAATRRQSRV